MPADSPAPLTTMRNPNASLLYKTFPVTNRRRLEQFCVRIWTNHEKSSTKRADSIKRACFVVLAFFAMVKTSPAQTFTPLLSFGSSGQDPQYMSFVQASTGGALYGTTYSGGAQSGGTVFKITPLGRPTTLYSFCAQLDCSDGLAPDWGLVKSANGNFYGMTGEGE